MTNQLSGKQKLDADLIDALDNVVEEPVRNKVTGCVGNEI